MGQQGHFIAIGKRLLYLISAPEVVSQHSIDQRLRPGLAQATGRRYRLIDDRVIWYGEFAKLV